MYSIHNVSIRCIFGFPRSHRFLSRSRLSAEWLTADDLFATPALYMQDHSLLSIRNDPTIKRNNIILGWFWAQGNCWWVINMQISYAKSDNNGKLPVISTRCHQLCRYRYLGTQGKSMGDPWSPINPDGRWASEFLSRYLNVGFRLIGTYPSMFSFAFLYFSLIDIKRKKLMI